MDSENVVQEIHIVMSEKERVNWITIDLPLLIYLDVRKRTIEQGTSLKDYFLKLYESRKNI